MKYPIEIRGWEFSEEEIKNRREQLLADINDMEDRDVVIAAITNKRQDSREKMLNSLSLMSCGHIETYGKDLKSWNRFMDWDRRNWYLSIDYDSRKDGYVIHIEMDKLYGWTRSDYYKYHK